MVDGLLTLMKGKMRLFLVASTWGSNARATSLVLREGMLRLSNV
jgi:hypothetical protein